MKPKRWSLITAFVVMFVALFSFYTPAKTEAAGVTYQIEINKTTNKLYLYKNGKVVWTRPVATGKNVQPIPRGSKTIPESATPEGVFPIVVKAVNPQWKNVPGTIKKKVNGKVVTVPNPANPLGPRWNGLSVNGDQGLMYGIHGTNNPSSIGKHISHGCIRMNNQDVIKLFDIVPYGTPVWIHSGKSDNHWRGQTSSHKRKPLEGFQAPYPGAQYFKMGAKNVFVYQLGVMLQKVHKDKYYRVGPTYTFTEADRKNVQAFQLEQGWKGTKRGQAADGYPGPETWARLVQQSKIFQVNTTKN